MARGNLRILLRAAPGAGKTFAMLEEGRRLAGEGFDVVVGAVSLRGRADTAELLDGLELCTKGRPDGPHEQADVDVPALIARHPGLVLVDDYAATAQGRGRWQQIEELLQAGMDVISTLDIRNMESLSDAVRRVTGVEEANTVPDAAVRRADQIELIDASPELLRQPDYRDPARVLDGWPAREKIVIGVDGRAQDQVLVRRAARMLAAAAGGELHVVHVHTSTDGRGPESGKDLELLRRVTAELGGGIRGRDQVTIAHRSISSSSQRQALSVALLGIAPVVSGTMLLLMFTDYSLEKVLLESSPAFATVGMSTGITYNLPPAAEWVLMALMFTGRIGIVAVASALALSARPRLYRLPEERPIIG